MNIEIITTSNKGFDESGFGNLLACQNVQDSIKKSGHESRISPCDSLFELEQVLARKPDLAVLALKHISVEDGQKIWLSEFFANRALLYTGSAKNTILFDSDENLAKQYLKDKGIPTLSSDEDIHSEYTVAMLTTKNGVILVSATEILPSLLQSENQAVKNLSKNERIDTLRKITDKKISYHVRKLAFEVFLGLGVEGFARIDISSNHAGKYFFKSVELVPALTQGSSLFPEAFRIDRGLSYDQTIAHMIDYSLHKEFKARQRTHLFPIHQEKFEFARLFEENIE